MESGECMAAVFIGVPHHDQLAPQALEGLILATAQHRYSINTEGGSLLALMFNLLWCRALNQRDEHGWTHFAMHHSDVEAPAGWLDTLIQEQQRVGADVLACVIPIKDNRGLTSTGWQDPETRTIRRFTMAEVLTLPVTFNAAQAGKYGQYLMVNTGLWVCDFTRPWVEDVCFTIRDGIGKDPGGRFWPRAIPEDWGFSTWAAEQGLKVFATRKVPIIHHGRAGYSNAKPWGEWQTDQGDY
jgi:hypothetical protein